MFPYVIQAETKFLLTVDPQYCIPLKDLYTVQTIPGECRRPYIANGE